MFKTFITRSILKHHNGMQYKYNCLSNTCLFTESFSKQPKKLLPILNNSFFKSLNSVRICHQNRNENTRLRFFSENNHGHKIMQSIPFYKNTLSKPMAFCDSTTITELEFENLVGKHWRSHSATEIVNAFKTAYSFSKINNISLLDHRFDKLVDGLMDRCQDLTDNELSNMLTYMREYPSVDSITSHNFHDIWSALDDICSSRLMKWPVDTLLFIADHWYQLGLCKFSDYILQCIKRLSRKSHQLTAPQLVQTLFLINVCRQQWCMFDFECRLEKHISQLTTDELAIVSMSFFKTETQIKGTFLLAHMLTKALEDTTIINEITLCAILKIVRYSPHLPLVDKLQELLNKLVPEIDRLSLLCCVHIALAGTNTQLFHPEILTKISEKFISNISEARLKDLERLTFVLTQFNFRPKTSKCIFNIILTELSNPMRQLEIEKYPRCFSCCLHFLCLQEIYSYELISNVLNDNFLKKAYGSNKQKIGREILFLNTSLLIECPDYRGNHLENSLQKKLSKWTVDWIPKRDQKQRLSAADKLMLDILETTEHIHGGKQYVHVDNILPHFQRADIIICKDKNGIPVKIDNIKKYPVGDIMKAEDDGNIWYVIIVASWNSYIRGTRDPTGNLATKIRHLKKIGYIPIMVPWHDFAHLTKQQKEEYIRNKIR